MTKYKCEKCNAEKEAEEVPTCEACNIPMKEVAEEAPASEQPAAEPAPEEEPSEG